MASRIMTLSIQNYPNLIELLSIINHDNGCPFKLIEDTFSFPINWKGNLDLIEKAASSLSREQKEQFSAGDSEFKDEILLLKTQQGIEGLNQLDKFLDKYFEQSLDF